MRQARGLTVAVILCGGAGSRLWPRSRLASPKHLLPLSGSGEPLVRDTYLRIRALVDEVWVVTEEAQAGLIRAVLPELAPSQMVVEAAARGTTNALGLAALTLFERDPEAIMLSLPADHIVTGAAAFKQAVRAALRLAARTQDLVTIGLEPTHPATGFGYIKVEAETLGGAETAYRVARFVEKPPLKTAERFLAEGGYYWNLAMFSWPVRTFWEELERHGPRHAAGLKRVVRARREGDPARAAAAYRRLPVAAIDYTVMEKTGRLLLVPAHFRWVDVGSWSELAELAGGGASGNVVSGQSVVIDSQNCFISSEGRLIAAVGLNDLVVIDTHDAVLICDRSRAQDVKRVVEELRRTGRTQYL